MAILHEKLPKESAPRKGEVYTVCHGGAPLYEAEILKYGGGCWATVKVVKSESSMVQEGDSFDMRVAMYEFLPRAVQHETPAKH